MDPFHIMLTAFALMVLMIALTPLVKVFLLAIRGIVRSMHKTLTTITDCF